MPNNCRIVNWPNQAKTGFGRNKSEYSIDILRVIRSSQQMVNNFTKRLSNSLFEGREQVMN
jgi:hypothetical protein